MNQDPVTDAVARDLASFKEVTASVPPMPEPGAALAGPPFRDNRDGAVARRDADYEERRIELALLPLRLGRVFAHRVARATAGSVAALGAVALAGLMSKPWLMHLAAAQAGLSLELAVAGAATCILLSYLLALVVAERIYEHRAERAVTAGADPVRDLDRARPAGSLVSLLRRTDAPTVGLSILGVVSLLPLFGFLALDAIEHVLFGYDMRSHGFAAEHFAGLARNLGYVLVAISVFAILAGASWLACRRDDRGEGSRLLSVLGHWSMLVFGLLAGLYLMIGWLGTVVKVSRFASAPTPLVMASLALAGLTAIALPTIWAVLALRRREQRIVRRAAGLEP